MKFDPSKNTKICNFTKYLVGARGPKAAQRATQALQLAAALDSRRGEASSASADQKGG
jgi:hypothetical protein